MYPSFPVETVSAGVHMCLYFFTLVTAALSYLLLRQA